MDARILIIDDEESTRKLVKHALVKAGYECDVADSVKPAIDLMQTEYYNIVITDKNMPDLDGTDEGGMSILSYTHKELPETEVIMMTGFATLETAIEAMKLGAFDYITKPFSVRFLKDKIKRILEYQSFFNPTSTIGVYKKIHAEILELIEQSGEYSAVKIDEKLKELNEYLDKCFHVQKNYEQQLMLQREALVNIAAWAEELRDEEASPAERQTELINNIWQETQKGL